MAVDDEPFEEDDFEEPLEEFYAADDAAETFEEDPENFAEDPLQDTEELAEEPDAQPDEAEHAGDLAAVDEHLQDSIEGSMRLKRLLSEDGAKGDEGSKKRRLHEDDQRDPELKKKEETLMRKYGSRSDALMAHVLGNMSEKALDHLLSINFVPEKNNAKRSQPELLEQKVLYWTESSMIGQHKTDVIAAFCFYNKISAEGEKKVRVLSHKDLRYVMDNFDADRDLDELIEEGGFEEPKGESTTTACPFNSGSLLLSRFNRVELIDPYAHSGVFGDANLSFSVNLAQHRTGLGHVGRVIATTFEEITTLRERYAEIDTVITELEGHDAEVYHGVDCTRIATNPSFKGMEAKLGAVYYNFPHSGSVQGFFDSHPIVNWRHENLMRLFFRALRTFMKPGGIVKVASNSNATGVRWSFTVGGALENEFVHTETMPFTEWALHRYGRSYGDRRDIHKRLDAKNNESYNAQSGSTDSVYCFRYAPSGKVLGQQYVRMPPKLYTLRNCNDGPFKTRPNPAARETLATQLHERFVTEISGTHVG